MHGIFKYYKDIVILWSIATSSFSMLDTQVVQEFDYEYDKVGNITNINNKKDPEGDYSYYYTYDDLYRLTVASTTDNVGEGDYKRTYEYNAIGNITNKSDLGSYSYSGHTTTSFANPHAVTAVGVEGHATSSVFTYDLNGNVTGDGTWVYTWDYRDRLIEATDGSSTINYAYDHNNNRVSYSVGGNTTYYPNKYFNIDSNGTSTKHIFAGSELIATIEADGVTTSTYYIHTDHLGGSSVITDGSGEMVQQLDYYPFGDIRINVNSGFDEKKKFTGHEYDEDTSLNYMIARYQNPKTGLFISKDPWGGNKFDPQTLNKYNYSRNNPINYFDPTGRKVEVAYRKVRGTFGIGVHTFLIVTPDNHEDFGKEEGYSYTLGGYKEKVDDESKLVSGRDRDSNDTKDKRRTNITTPDGMTDTEFINSIEAEFESYDNDNPLDYGAFSKDDSYNCNDLTTSLIENSGGNLPDDYDPWGANPGLGGGIPDSDTPSTTITAPNSSSTSNNDYSSYQLNTQDYGTYGSTPDQVP